MQVGLVVPRESLEALGGASRIWRALFDALAARHDVEPILISETVSESDCASVLDDYARFSELDVADLDVVVATKYPAWVVNHHRVVIWMQHPLRGLYDLYPPGLEIDGSGPVDPALFASAKRGEPAALRDLAQIARDNPDHPVFAFPGPVARQVVTALDHCAIRSAERVLTISRTVAARPGYFPDGIHPRPVLHPQSLDVVTAEVEPGRLFTASRLDPMKRIDLIIEAVRRSDLVTELRIAGSGPDEERLRSIARGDERIVFLGVVSDTQLALEYAKASLVPFVPRDEDFGLVTLEAWAQSRPIVTVSDSGGVAEIVVNGETGLVAQPTSTSLSEAFDELLGAPSEADTLGELGAIRGAEITWDRVVTRLLRDRGGSRPSPRAAPAKAGSRRHRGGPTVVVVSSEEIGPGRHGGQVRARELYGSLQADVRFVSLGSSTSREEERVLGEAIEFVVPRSIDHLVAEHQLSDEAGVPLIDIAADELHHLTPRFGEVLRREIAHADVVVMSQPYLGPTVLSAMPSGAMVVYDAQNVEADLKADLLDGSASARSVHADVVRLEECAVKAADLVVAVTEHDRTELVARYGQPPASVVIANGVRVKEVQFVGVAERMARQARLLRALGAADAEMLGLFLGSLHPPNVEGARQLVEEIAARHARADEVLSVHVLFAGGHARALDPSQLPVGAHSLATLGSTRKKAMLSSCPVALNPVTTGSGSNLKLVEYLASGCSVVTTEFGSRGFDELRDAFVVAEPGELLASAAELAFDPRGNDDRARFGRALVKDSHDWPILAARLGAELNLQ